MDATTTVILLRGLPGSGKTTWARAFQARKPTAVIASADDYFLSNGLYVFQRELLPKAHDACVATCHACLEWQVPYLLVDNTHLRPWEYRRVRELAVVYQAAVYQKVCTGTWDSTHAGVTGEGKLRFMRRRFEYDFSLPHWPECGCACH